MNEEKTDNELSHWFSTYGIITSERILGRYMIKLRQTELIDAIKSPVSFYNHLLQVPLKCVLNGIILQQANDYHVYVQKLFIDYLLSGESAKDEEAQGASTRAAIERERQQLVVLGDEFNKVQGQHNSLIAKSQKVLITITNILNNEIENTITSLRNLLKSQGFNEKKSTIRQGINKALIFCNRNEVQSNQFLVADEMNQLFKLELSDDLKQKIAHSFSKILQITLEFDEQTIGFVEQVDDLSSLSNNYRTQFYETAIRVMELIKLLPDYKIDLAQDMINREPLDFDNSIGA